MEYYVVAVDSYEGNSSRREQGTWSGDDPLIPARALYAILRVDEVGASIVDDGYHSREEATETWPEAR